jgi:hypothetical protein
VQIIGDLQAQAEKKYKFCYLSSISRLNKSPQPGYLARFAPLQAIGSIETCPRMQPNRFTNLPRRTFVLKILRNCSEVDKVPARFAAEAE